MTGLVYDERMLQHKHEWFPAEQESPVRMQRAYERCSQEGLVDRCTLVPARHIAEADLSLIHSREYVQMMKKSRNFTRPDLYDLSGQFDGVFVNEWTWNCASLAAGSLQHLTGLVAAGQLTNGLALIRPPGHHAMHAEACGYCVFNNVAIAAASLLDAPPKVIRDPASPSQPGTSPSLAQPGRGERRRQQPVVLDRILIVDWDVHHGQGTQYAFYHDKRVLFVSIHRHEKSKFWPNLREADYDFVGGGDARGFNINIPLNDTGMCDSDYLAIFHNLLMPIALEFDPQLVIVSCGFDAAIGCPEGRMWLTPAVFGHFVHYLKMLAGGKIVLSLEGGYYVDSLAEGTVHVLKALLGDPVTPVRLTRPPCKSIRRTIDACTTALRGYWKSLNIPGVSRIVDRPIITHMSSFTWPLVRRVVWPETNPMMPVPLMQHVSRVLREYLPGPVALASQGTLQLLLPVFRLAGADSSRWSGQAKQSRPVEKKSLEETDAWSTSLLLSLSKLMGINFFVREKSQSQVAGKSPTTERQPTNRRKRAHSQLASSSSVEDSRNNSSDQHASTTETSRWDPNKAMETADVDFQTALRQAVEDLLHVRVSRLLVCAEPLDLSTLLDVVTGLPVHLLVYHRKEMLRPRAEPLTCCCAADGPNGSDFRGPSPLPDQLTSSLPGEGHAEADEEQWRLARQIDQLEEITKQRKLMADSVTDRTVDSKSQAMSQYLPLLYQPNVARLFVVDLTESPRQPWTTEKQVTSEGTSGTEMQCDVTWCSIWHARRGKHKGDQSSTSQLRAVPLHATRSSTRANRLRNGYWLRVPVFSEPASWGRQPSASSRETPAIADLIAVVVHLVLPIAYESAPDLVCLQVHSDWLNKQAPEALGVAYALHLLNGLGAPVLVNCCYPSSSLQPPPIPSVLLLDVLLGNAQLPSLGTICPSEEVQVMLRSAMRANSDRWKCLKFAGNLVEWR